MNVNQKKMKEEAIKKIGKIVKVHDEINLMDDDILKEDMFKLMGKKGLGKADQTKLVMARGVQEAIDKMRDEPKRILKFGDVQMHSKHTTNERGEDYVEFRISALGFSLPARVFTLEVWKQKGMIFNDLHSLSTIVSNIKNSLSHVLQEISEFIIAFKMMSKLNEVEHDPMEASRVDTMAKVWGEIIQHDIDAGNDWDRVIGNKFPIIWQILDENFEGETMKRFNLLARLELFQEKEEVKEFIKDETTDVHKKSEKMFAQANEFHEAVSHMQEDKGIRKAAKKFAKLIH